MVKIDHPYRSLTGGKWLRGNLHAHTTVSDGSRTPQRTINDYAKRGYDFLAITDHDVQSTSKDYRKWDAKGLVLINGNEISANGPHIVHLDGSRLVEPLPIRQEALNLINDSKGMAVIAHPNWMAKFDDTTVEQLQEWIGYVGIEIFNGLIGRLKGTRYCTNKWDQLLTQGRRIWGFANDDSHSDEDVEQGWNMVYTKDRSAKAVLDALRMGRFYASTGVVINRIQVKGATIRIETENAARIVGVKENGRRVATVDDSGITYQVPSGVQYVRFECWGTGESFAWTQPFFVKG